MNVRTRQRLALFVGLLATSLALYWAAGVDAPVVEVGLFAILGGLALAAVRWG